MPRLWYSKRIEEAEEVKDGCERTRTGSLGAYHYCNQAFGNDESTWQLPHAIREVCLLVCAVFYCSS